MKVIIIVILWPVLEIFLYFYFLLQAFTLFCSFSFLTSCYLGSDELEEKKKDEIKEIDRVRKKMNGKKDRSNVKK